MFKDIKVNFEINMFIEVRRNKKTRQNFLKVHNKFDCYNSSVCDVCGRRPADVSCAGPVLGQC